jgi:hypothetical protein
MNRAGYVSAASSTSDLAVSQSMLLDEASNEGSELSATKQGGKSSNEECIASVVVSNDCGDPVDGMKAVPISQDEEQEAVETDEDDDDETESGDDDDDFNANGIAMPKLSSSTVPIIVEVSNSHKARGFYSSEDPLFQGVCLYSSTKDETGDQGGLSGASSRITMPKALPVEEQNSESRLATSKISSDATVTEEESNSWYIRFVPSMFQFLRFE